jgi:hypothetical protein
MIHMDAKEVKVPQTEALWLHHNRWNWSPKGTRGSGLGLVGSFEEAPGWRLVRRFVASIAKLPCVLCLALHCMDVIMF